MLLEDVNKVVEKLKEKISDQLNETKIIETRNIFINKYLNPIYEQLRLATVEQKKELGLISKKLKDQIFLIVDERLKNIERDNENKIHLPKYNINIETANFTKGSITPISMMMNEIVEYFESLNFKSYYGSEVVPTSYNFDRLNIGPFHPARDPKDCFFINDTLMLRAHCTAVTAQILENNKADDIRIVTFGNVYRNDDDDNTHSHQFTQVDIV
jgi:phenylalanyl-tRNA synthetase alpha chain